MSNSLSGKATLAPGLAAWLLLWTLAACGPAPPGVTAASESSEQLFVDRAQNWGLDFVHQNGMTGQLYFNEVVGAGVALLDYDRDGDLDIYVLQGGPQASTDDAEGAPSEAKGRLFRNDLQAGSQASEPRFADVTENAGLEAYCYGMGVAVGDLNDDGWPDLYLTCFGSNQLWLNRGDGTFVERIAEAGLDDPRWSTSAAFVDLDRDGRLDLYLVNYTDFSLDNHRPCRASGGGEDYCGPRSYQPESDRLWLNRSEHGTLRFVDLSEQVGLAAVASTGLGVVSLDADGDGWQDLYVANDQEPNHLWVFGGLNADGVPTLREEGLLRGTAVDSLGRPQASMGVDAGDVDGDGDTDLFVTHLRGETNTLYLNDGRGMFLEHTAAVGLASESVPLTGFGTALLDVDNDGWLDVIAVNGEVRLIPEQVRAGVELALQQPNLLFRNQGGRFQDWTSSAPVLRRELVSRGLAVGDVDNDGDADVVLSNNHGPLELLINQVGQDAPWLGLRLLTQSGRAALGAEVRLPLDDGRELVRTVRRAASYLSSNDPRLIFGLRSEGRSSQGHPLQVHIRWPDGEAQTVSGLEMGAYNTVQQGVGLLAKENTEL